MSKTVFIVGAPEADEARIYMSPGADKPVKKDAVIPFGLKGASQMNLSFAHPSLVLMDPGVRFVRMGEFTLSTTTTWRRNAVGEMRGGAAINDLTLYGDLRLDIPANAKAVYIGTLRYNHNGVESQKVSVVDDYKNTMEELNKMNFGITSKDVVKRLAKVVREN